MSWQSIPSGRNSGSACENDTLVCVCAVSVSWSGCVSVSSNLASASEKEKTTIEHEVDVISDEFD